MLISNANAQTEMATMAGSGASSWIMIGVMFLIMWLFILRPQTKRHKEHQALITGLKRGDKVVTDSGFYGVISKVVDESIVEVEIAENIRVEMVRNAVAAVTGNAKIKSIPAGDKKKTKAKIAKKKAS
jgi:preprotein translocase subunit YajC